MINETDNMIRHRGCLIMNTSNEFAQKDASISAIIKNNLEQITGVLEKAVLQGQVAGEINQKIEMHILTLYITSSISGLKNMIKADTDKETTKQIVKLVIKVLD